MWPVSFTVTRTGQSLRGGLRGRGCPRRRQHEKRLGGRNPGAQGSMLGVYLATARKAPCWGRPSSASHAGQTCLCCVSCFPPINLHHGLFLTPVNGKRMGFGGKADLGLNPSLAPNSGWNPEQYLNSSKPEGPFPNLDHKDGLKIKYSMLKTRPMKKRIP